ncbi:MAG: saccharopine dehydrogenase family protein [Roseibacillus sp.]
MARILIIGAGGVANVMAVKVSQESGIFQSVTIASRTHEKCERIAERLAGSLPVHTTIVDASDAAAVASVIRDQRSEIVLNAALPEQNLPVMEACLAAGAHYIDTSAPEPVPGNYEMFAYKWQLAFHDRFREAGLTALLSIGFDPGVTNVLAAHAAERLDVVESLDILDCNGGSHGHPFATNFNPVTNIQEITQPSVWWEGERWREEPAFATQASFDLPELGINRLTRIYHEELETLVPRIPGLQRAQFWMGFSDEYLKHIEVLGNVGLLSMKPVDYGGTPVVPLKFLCHTLPDPASLGAYYTGKTNIGCLVRGRKDGRPKSMYLYNVCDHEAAYAETGSQAVSYTAGVPPVVAAELLLSPCTDWNKPGVWVPEDLPTAPMLTRLAKRGLPWHIIDGDNVPA